MNAQQLKNSIFHYAVEGKLVQQNSSDESVESILKTINIEKEILFETKQIKKVGKFSPIKIEETPFEIPGNWRWVRIQDITTFGNFDTTQPQNIDNEAWVLDLEEIEKNTGTLLTVIKNKEKSVLSNKYRFKKGDVLYGKLRPYLNKVIVAPDTGYCTTEIFPLHFLGGIIPEYAQLVLMSPYFLNYATQSAYGAKMPRMGTPHMSLGLFPLPPLEEQKRIINKINVFTKLIDDYGKLHERQEELNFAFPINLEKSILQYAMQGKLVDQDPSDEPAVELVNRIREEKVKLVKEKVIKKEKTLPPITEEEVPFDIPKNWEWVRLGEAITLVSGQDFPPGKYNHNGIGTPYITGASTLTTDGVILNRWTETPQSIAQNGDVLLVCKGSGYGKTMICDIEIAHIARQIMAIKKSDFMNMEFVEFYLRSNRTLIKKLGQGVIPGIDRNSILTLLLPLPPLKEQNRIVEKIKKNYTLINKLHVN